MQCRRGVWSLGWRRSAGGGTGNPLQYSCLKNPMDRGAWRATVHMVAKNWTLLSDWACTVNLKCCVWVYSKVLQLYVCVLCLVTRSSPTLCDPMVCRPPGSSVHEDSPGKNTSVGCHALPQGIFPTQGSNLGPLHCRRILTIWATMYVCIVCVCILLQILFHCRLLYNIEYSSLCYTVGPCCLPVLYIVVCI